MSVVLDGFEQWVHAGDIVVNQNQRELKLSLQTEDQSSYDTQAGRLELIHGFKGTRPSPTDSAVSVRLQSIIRFTPSKRTNALGMKAAFRSIQDLLLILTNSPRQLDWPTIQSGSQNTPIRLYFERFGSKGKDLQWHQSWTSFPRLKKDFGKIFDAWHTQRDRAGPGIHLFLGTKRDIPLYVEHRFVNLVWGLESLHRRGAPSNASKLADKKERILSRLFTLKSDDKRWLKLKLSYILDEPSLETRLFEVLKPIGLNLEERRLEKFAKTCANLRNDLSHFGGERTPGQYDGFIGEIRAVLDALSTLYHLLILKLIGLTDEQLAYVAFQRPESQIVARSFERAGLIDKRSAPKISDKPSPNEEMIPSHVKRRRFQLSASTFRRWRTRCRF